MAADAHVQGRATDVHVADREGGWKRGDAGGARRGEGDQHGGKEQTKHRESLPDPERGDLARTRNDVARLLVNRQRRRIGAERDE
ncbi:hypothetical protein GCM10023232_29020 [Sphingosinicella ginsenosidimutans]